MQLTLIVFLTICLFMNKVSSSQPNPPVPVIPNAIPPSLNHGSSGLTRGTNEEPVIPVLPSNAPPQETDDGTTEIIGKTDVSSNSSYMFSTNSINSTSGEGKLLKVFSSPTKRDLRSQLRLCTRHALLPTAKINEINNSVRDWVFDESKDNGNLLTEKVIERYLNSKKLFKTSFKNQKMFEVIVKRLAKFSEVLVKGLSLQRGFPRMGCSRIGYPISSGGYGPQTPFRAKGGRSRLDRRP